MHACDVCTICIYSMHFPVPSTGTKIISVPAHFIPVSVVELELKLEK